MQSLISVIIPFYNVEKYIEECILSVLGQDYKNLEILFVNDGSTDGSAKIVEKYAKVDERITVINKKNGGVSSARNVGMDVAKGEYLLFVDSDDLLAKNMISELYKLSKEHDADIVTCDSLPFYDTFVAPETTMNLKIHNDPKKVMQMLLSNQGMEIAVTRRIFKTDAIGDLRFNENCIMYEDMLFLYNLSLRINRFVEAGSTLYFYRQREGSLMHAKYTDRHIDLLSVFNDFEKTIKENTPELLPEFYYYKLCVIGDQYKTLVYSSYDNKKDVQKLLREEYKQTKEKPYRKELQDSRQKVLWSLTTAPTPIYKTVVNLVRILKGGKTCV